MQVLLPSSPRTQFIMEFANIRLSKVKIGAPTLSKRV